MKNRAILYQSMVLGGMLSLLASGQPIEQDVYLGHFDLN